MLINPIRSGELEFANGTLEFSVTFGPDDVIMAFFLYSAKTPTAFVKEIETASYVERSQAVIQAFYSGNPSGVFPHFHVGLRSKVGEDGKSIDLRDVAEDLIGFARSTANDQRRAQPIRTRKIHFRNPR